MLFLFVGDSQARVSCSKMLRSRSNGAGNFKEPVRVICSSVQPALARHGDTILVSSLILEHPQARSVRLQPSLVTPSTMQLMEQGGRLSRRVVALGVVVAPAVTAAKSRMKSWRRAFILTMVSVRRRETDARSTGRLWISEVDREGDGKREANSDRVGLRG